jgi:hypothetical protein
MKIRSVSGEGQASRSVTRIKNHHDNEKAHIHKDVFSYLELEGFTIISHSPNPLNLSRFTTKTSKGKTSKEKCRKEKYRKRKSRK